MSWMVRGKIKTQQNVYQVSVIDPDATESDPFIPEKETAQRIPMT